MTSRRVSEIPALDLFHTCLNPCHSSKVPASSPSIMIASLQIMIENFYPRHPLVSCSRNNFMHAALIAPSVHRYFLLSGTSICLVLNLMSWTL